MNQKVIYFFNHFSGSLFSLLSLGFFALAAINSHYDFSISPAAKVRDLAPVFVSSVSSENTYETLDKNSSARPELAASFARAYNYSYAYTPASTTPSVPTFSTIYSADPSIDAQSNVMRYNGVFLYAHSTRAFNPLKTLYVGSTFVADGITYRVSRREVFAKSYLDDRSGLRLALYNATYTGKTYDLALMTCGNGSNNDENYRLVLFANRI